MRWASDQNSPDGPLTVSLSGVDLNLPEWIGDVYWLFMITGVTAVQDPQNHRYPEITPEPLDDIARRILPANHER